MITNLTPGQQPRLRDSQEKEATARSFFFAADKLPGREYNKNAVGACWPHGNSARDSRREPIPGSSFSSLPLCRHGACCLATDFCPLGPRTK